MLADSSGKRLLLSGKHLDEMSRLHCANELLAQDTAALKASAKPQSHTLTPHRTQVSPPSMPSHSTHLTHKREQTDTRQLQSPPSLRKHAHTHVHAHVRTHSHTLHTPHLMHKHLLPHKHKPRDSRQSGAHTARSCAWSRELEDACAPPPSLCRCDASRCSMLGRMMSASCCSTSC